MTNTFSLLDSQGADFQLSVVERLRENLNPAGKLLETSKQNLEGSLEELTDPISEPDYRLTNAVRQISEIIRRL